MKTRLSPEFLDHAHKMRAWQCRKHNYYHTRPILRACRDILQGFKSLEEAEGYAEIFAGRDLCSYDGYGYPITPTMITEAVAIVRQYELVGEVLQ